jgi:hypothetical protein
MYWQNSVFNITSFEDILQLKKIYSEVSGEINSRFVTCDWCTNVFDVFEK